jgi:GntR family transcriptional regulator, transcriptional repressor for pyruvate dehydrogenase complex
MVKPSGLTPVVKVTSAQSVAHQLIEMIRRGVWKAGDQLPTEKELIEELSVGRSTIREALQILATLNVVQASPGQGTFIKTPTASEMFRPEIVGVLIGDTATLQLLEAREMIEPQCVRLAAIRGTIADLDAVARAIDEHEAAHRAGQPVSTLGGRFHIRLAESSRNDVSVTFMSSILGLLAHRARWIDSSATQQKREIDEHREILEVVRARDPDRASEMMRRHIVSWAGIYVSEGLPGGNSLLTEPNPTELTGTNH